MNENEKIKATIEIEESQIVQFIENSIDVALEKTNVSGLIEHKVNAHIQKYLKTKLSDEKLDNITRDRISRIITTESIKEYSYGVTDKDVVSNLESKILLMIQNSKEFKQLVKSVLKESL